MGWRMCIGDGYKKRNSVVKEGIVGYVFKEKTRLRKTNDAGVGC